MKTNKYDNSKERFSDDNIAPEKEKTSFQPNVHSRTSPVNYFGTGFLNDTTAYLED